LARWWSFDWCLTAEEGKDESPSEQRKSGVGLKPENWKILMPTPATSTAGVETPAGMLRECLPYRHIEEWGTQAMAVDFVADKNGLDDACFAGECF